MLDFKPIRSNDRKDANLDPITGKKCVLVYIQLRYILSGK